MRIFWRASAVHRADEIWKVTAINNKPQQIKRHEESVTGYSYVLGKHYAGLAVIKHLKKL